MKSLLLSISAATAVLACGAGLLGTPAANASELRRQNPAGGLAGRSAPHALAQDPSETSLRVTPVVKAVRKAADSVVSIYVVDRRMLRRFGEASADGQGSGVVLDESGLVITNWHVVALALADASHTVRVKLKNGKSYPAEVLSSSADDDLALLQLELRPGEKVKPVVLGDSDSLMIGETVIAIGNPRGNANSVTAGVLSAVGRTIRVRTPDGRVRRYDQLLQTDAAINRGNSGGALLDITGKLIGINNAMAADAENIGFAIPVNTVKRVFREVLLSAENLASVWLGMAVEDRDGIVRVTEVDPWGPAARAGVREGDVLEEAAGARIRSKLDFARRTLRARAGRDFPLRLRRGSRSFVAHPVPMSAAAKVVLRLSGLEVEQIAAEDDPDLVRAATREFYAGSGHWRVPLLPAVLRVVRVVPGSPADRLGIEPGDVLLGTYLATPFGARTMPLTAVAELADRLREARGGRLPIFLLRDGEWLEGELPVR